MYSGTRNPTQYTDTEDTNKSKVLSDTKPAHVPTGQFWEKVNDGAKQTTRFVLLHRPYITLGAIAFFMLPLFNFASMGALAYVAYPLLVLATFQLLYNTASSGILGHGLKIEEQGTLATWFNKLFSLTSYEAEQSYKGAASPVTEEATGNVTEEEEKPFLGQKDEASKSWTETVSAWFTSLGQMDAVRMSYDWTKVQGKWNAAAVAENKNGTWLELATELAKIALISVSVYYTAVALAPIVINPLHALLGFAGPAGLVASYFLTLGVFYAGALALNQMKTLDTAKNEKVLDATVAITGLGAVALVVCSILFANTSILAGVMSLPTLLGVVAPVALLLVAGSTITYTAASDKLQKVELPKIELSKMFDCTKAAEIPSKEGDFKAVAGSSNDHQAESPLMAKGASGDDGEDGKRSRSNSDTSYTSN